MHANQLTVTVDEQFPSWSDLPIRQLPAQGTVNALFRLGTDLVARFPLLADEPDAAWSQLEGEVRAARELLGRTTHPTPEPVALGRPGRRYPMPWMVQTWIPGVVATPDEPGHSIDFAQDLAEFVRSVRAIPTRGRVFHGPGRGGSLPDHDAWVRTCLDRSRDLLDVVPLRELWARLRSLPPSPGGDLMTHGDLIPGNVLVTDGRLSGVIDVSGAGPADPALDLVAGWHLLDETPRQRFRDAIGVGDLEWSRGAAWALEQALGAVWYYADSNPAMSLMGRRTLERLVAAPPFVP